MHNIVGRIPDQSVLSKGQKGRVIFPPVKICLVYAVSLYTLRSKLYTITEK